MTKTKDLKAFKPVTGYRTVDGQVFFDPDGEKKAQEHAESCVGDQLQTIINAAGLDLGHSTTFHLCLYMIHNAPEIIETLKQIHAFEEEEP